METVDAGKSDLCKEEAGTRTWGIGDGMENQRWGWGVGMGWGCGVDI